MKFTGELAYLGVPQNYLDSTRGTLRLAIARLPSTGRLGEPPIIYLAVGPGAWGIHPERMPLLDALRAFGDVYTFDQRGTGQSNPVLSCPRQLELPFGAAPSEAALTAMYREQASGIASPRGEPLGVFPASVSPVARRAAT